MQTAASLQPIHFASSIHAPINRAEVYPGLAGLSLRFGTGVFPEFTIYCDSHEDAINAVTMKQAAARQARQDAEAGELAETA